MPQAIGSFACFAFPIPDGLYMYEMIFLEKNEIFQQGKNKKNAAVENHAMLLNKFMLHIMCGFELTNRVISGIRLNGLTDFAESTIMKMERMFLF